MTYRYVTALGGTPGARTELSPAGTSRPFDAQQNEYYEEDGYPVPPADQRDPIGMVYSAAQVASAPTSVQVAAGDTYGYFAWALPGGGSAAAETQTENCHIFSMSLYLPSPQWRDDDNQLPITVMQVFGNLYYQGQKAFESYPVAQWDLRPPEPGEASPGNQEWVVRAVAGVSSFSGIRIPLDTWVRLTLKITVNPHTITTSVSKLDGTVIAAPFTQNNIEQIFSNNTGGYTVGALYAVAFGNFVFSYDKPPYRFYIDDIDARSCDAVDPPPAPTDDPQDYDNSSIPNNPNDGYLPDDDGTRDIPCPPRYLPQTAAAAPTRLRRLGRAASYRCAILNRGGRTLIWDVPERSVTGVTWERRANETGVHTLTVAKRQSLLGPLGRVRTWAHEAVIWRVPERGQPQLCAVGPITGRLEDSDSVKITFKDLSAWWGKRVIHSDYAYTGCTDLTEIARFLVNDGMAPDDPNFLQHCVWIPSGVSVERAGSAYRLMLDKEISDLTGLGLDWTMTGRRLVVSGELARLWPRVARLNRSHFLGDVEVEEAGDEALTRTFITGAGTTIGYAGGVDEHLGLLESTANNDAVADGLTARIAARAALAVAYPAPVYVRVPDGAQLSPSCPLTLEQLVPGIAVWVDIDGYAYRVGQTQRLTRVAGEWSAEGGEKIAVALAPYAPAPADDGSPVGPPDPVEDVESEPEETIADQASDAFTALAALPGGTGDTDDPGADDDVLPDGAEEGDTGGIDDDALPGDGPDTTNPGDTDPAAGAATTK